MKVVFEWLRRLRWCARLNRLILSAIVMSLWFVVSAAQTSGTCECDEQCPKTRELVTTIWGGAVTLFVLSLDSWGAGKASMGDLVYTFHDIGRLFTYFSFFILCPALMLLKVSGTAAWSYHMRRRMPGFTVLSLLSPWTKDPAKILCSCEVVITVPTVIVIPENFTMSNLPSLCEAVVIGRGQGESRDTRDIYLSYKGKEVLLQMDVLPPYDQLKVLQGSSGLATILSAVQSIGYIYGVTVRTSQGLPVSPIEVVALTLSIQILIKALLHNIGSICHRPLHVYLTDGEAQTFVDTCENYTAHEVTKSQVLGPFVVRGLLVSSVAIYYIIHMWQTTRRILVVPIMITLVGFYFQLFMAWPAITQYASVLICISTMSAIINVTSYVFALVVTIKYWQVDRLNAKTSSMLAQIFPYIG